MLRNSCAGTARWGAVAGLRKRTKRAVLAPQFERNRGDAALLPIRCGRRAAILGAQDFGRLAGHAEPRFERLCGLRPIDDEIEIAVGQLTMGRTSCVPSGFDTSKSTSGRRLPASACSTSVPAMTRPFADPRLGAPGPQTLDCGTPLRPGRRQDWGSMPGAMPMMVAPASASAASRLSAGKVILRLLPPR